MAQTTNAISFQDHSVEYSTNGTAWTNFDGFSVAVLRSGGERQVGSVYTADGDFPIVKGGKWTPTDVTVRVVYTEPDADPYRIIRNLFQAKTPLYVRWMPKGNAADSCVYTTGAGIIRACPEPAGAAGSPDPVTVEIIVQVNGVTDTKVAS